MDTAPSNSSPFRWPPADSFSGDSLRLSKAHFDDMIEHARDGMPDEVCGLLAGHECEVKEVIRLDNIDPSPVSYTMDPKQQLKAERKIVASGLELVGIYHSHPASAPYPSQTDIRRSFFPGTTESSYPGASYVIIGLGDGDETVRAYSITSQGVSKVVLMVVQ